MPDFLKKRKTAAIINLDAIRQNIINIRNRVGPKVKICPAVKADAYGHGAIQVSRMLEREKLVEYFGVAVVSEGVELRKNGITLPILLFGITPDDELETAIEFQLTLTVCTKEHIDAAAHESSKQGKIAKIHIKVDTGMGRIGCKPKEVLILSKHCKSYDSIDLEGLFTHFPTSDETDKQFANQQIKEFNALLQKLDKHNMHIPIKHMANSGAILDLPNSYFDMVRPGIMIYGHYPSDETTESVKLHPAMKLRTEISFIKKVSKGTSISYGRSYIAPFDTNIATIPIGYADGVNRLLSNKHTVVINGKLYPIAGRVCMDQCMVELKDDYYPVGTEVSVFDFDTFTASDVAKLANTIPYEITCMISKRVLRYYQ